MESVLHLPCRRSRDVRRRVAHGKLLGACRHVGGDDRLLWYEDVVLAASLHVPQRYGRGGGHRRDQLDWQPRRPHRPHRGRLAQGYDRQLRSWPVLPLGLRAGLGRRHPGRGARAALAGRAYGRRNDAGVTTSAARRSSRRSQACRLPLHTGNTSGKSTRPAGLRHCAAFTLVRTISGVRMLCNPVPMQALEAGMMNPRRLSTVPAPLLRSAILATGVVGLLAAFGPAGIQNTGPAPGKDISAPSLSTEQELAGAPQPSSMLNNNLGQTDEAMTELSLAGA